MVHRLRSEGEPLDVGSAQQHLAGVGKATARKSQHYRRKVNPDDRKTSTLQHRDLTTRCAANVENPTALPDQHGENKLYLSLEIRQTLALQSVVLCSVVEGFTGLPLYFIR